MISGTKLKRTRRKDVEFSGVTAHYNDPRTYQYMTNIPLRDAINIANTESGVYILWLDGVPMKCGSAINPSVRGRLRQYYNLGYDKRAQSGDYWSVKPTNRDRVSVSWQCCPVAEVRNLESRLFRKYGKGAWAHRAPGYADSKWPLFI